MESIRHECDGSGHCNMELFSGSVMRVAYCHNLSPDTPDWPPTHLWDLTYPPTSTLDSGHSDFPTTPGTIFSCPTDPTCLPTCLPATPEDSIWSGSHMKMCTWCTGPSNRSSDAL